MLTNVGELCNRFRLILDPDVRVPHRHLDVGVPGQLLGFRKRNSISDELRDIRVPSSGVKVRHPFFGQVRDSDSLQILFDHEPCPTLFQFRKEQLVWLQVDDLSSDLSDKFRLKRQHVFLPMFRVGGFDGDGRRSCVEIKTISGQASQLSSPETSVVRGHVDSGSGFAIVTLN